MSRSLVVSKAAAHGEASAEIVKKKPFITNLKPLRMKPVAQEHWRRRNMLLGASVFLGRQHESA
jgi:hypothetical protein